MFEVNLWTPPVPNVEIFSRERFEEFLSIHLEIFGRPLDFLGALRSQNLFLTKAGNTFKL